MKKVVPEIFQVIQVNISIPFTRPNFKAMLKWGDILVKRMRSSMTFSLSFKMMGEDGH